MMKPHEEEWSIDDVLIMKTPQGLALSDARDRLGAAAPRMARALLKRLSPEAAPCLCHLTTPDTCDNCLDRAMLREAGVL